MNWGLGPFRHGELYQHGGFCSGIGYYPRRPGNTCSCWRSDLAYRRLFVERHYDGHRYTGCTKRTIYAATCGCGKRREFPYADEPIPREIFCQDCRVWVKVEELSWDGLDFSDLLPVVPR